MIKSQNIIYSLFLLTYLFHQATAATHSINFVAPTSSIRFTASHTPSITSSTIPSATPTITTPSSTSIISPTSTHSPITSNLTYSSTSSPTNTYCPTLYNSILPNTLVQYTTVTLICVQVSPFINDSISYHWYYFLSNETVSDLNELTSSAGVTYNISIPNDLNRFYCCNVSKPGCPLSSDISCINSSLALLSVIRILNIEVEIILEQSIANPEYIILNCDITLNNDYALTVAQEEYIWLDSDQKVIMVSLSSHN